MHVAFHCPLELKYVILKSFNKKPKTHLSAIDNKGFGYIFKQHKSYSPEITKKLKSLEINPLWKREAGDFIKGSRFNVSTDLKKIYPTPDWVKPDRCGVRPTRRYSNIIKRIHRNNPSINPNSKHLFSGLGLFAFIHASIEIDEQNLAKAAKVHSSKYDEFNVRRLSPKIS